MTLRQDPVSGRPQFEPRLEYVRPGSSALIWLEATLAELKGGDPFRPMTVVVPNDYAGRVVRWHLSRSGGFANVATRRIGQVADSVARPLLGRSRRPTESRVFESSAVRESLRLNPSEFTDISHSSLQAELVALFRELRRGDVDPDALRHHATARSTRTACAVYETFRELTRQYDTPTAVADAAAAYLRRVERFPAALARIGAIVLYLPTRVDHADARFLAAAGRWIPLVAAFIATGDPRDLGDEPSHEAARVVAKALGVDPPARPAHPRVLSLPSTTRVLRATATNRRRIREVIRRIAADLETGVPLHRIGIVYRQSDPYGPLLREALDAANLPWVSSEGLRLDESRPGRALVALLRLRDQVFSRQAVLEWLDLVADGVGLESGLSVAACDRLTRAANVVRGSAQWRQRLTTYANQLEGRVADLASDDASSPAIDGARRQARGALALADFVDSLAVTLRPPGDGGSWESFVTWTAGLRDRFLGIAADWPIGQRAAFDAMDEALASLRLADRFEGEGGTDARTFLAALGDALAERRLPTGEFGSGVTLEPLAAVTGLNFDRLYVVGMREGAFPPAPAVDPFFPPGTSDPLKRRERQRGQERRDFLTALACADSGELTLSVADSDGEREANPSRWLLEVASCLEADRAMDSTEFSRLDPKTRPWLAVIRSAVDSVSRAKVFIDREDRRLADVAKWTVAGRSLADHPLAHRAGLPLARALSLAEARRSEQLTEFDGNLSRRTDLARQSKAFGNFSRPISATAIETWFACGFRYFLGKVLKVEPTAEPEEIWSLRAIERGGLVHHALASFGSARSRDRSLDERALLAEVVESECTALEEAGVTGHPLDWENARGAIATDLTTFLTIDQRWQQTNGLAPALFEQQFGTAEDGAWPALPVVTADGTVWFRGVIDRVDVDSAGTRAIVFDYKTGSAANYGKLVEDPLGGGRHVQIALYREVARRNLVSVEGVSGAYWFVSSKEGFQLVPVVKGDDEIEDRLSQVVGAATRGILAGAFPQVSGEWRDGGFTNCHFCEFDRVCPTRRDQVWDRKRTDEIAALHAALGIGAAGDTNA